MTTLTQIGVASILTVSIVTFFMLAMNTNFSTYGEVDNATGQLTSVSDGGALIENYKGISKDLQGSMANAQTSASGGVIDQIAAAFGLLTTLVMSALKILFAVVSQTINMIAGFGFNLMLLPEPWSALSPIVYLISAIALFTIIMLLVRAYKIGDTI